MTFTQMIKSEVLKIKGDRKCCRRAMLYGMLLFSPWFEEGRISFTSENKEIAGKVIKLLSEFASVSAEDFPVDDSDDRAEYKVSITDVELCRGLLDSFGYADGSTYRILFENFNCDACRAAFLRGVFLSCASAVAPDSGYHLEFVVSRFNLSRELVRFLKICKYEAKYTKRNSHYIVYFKDSDAIVDIIAFIGAINCCFDMTNYIIEKNIRNNCNRLANCETANLKRTISTAHRQLDAIRGLLNSDNFNSLSEELRETAMLRVENDDISLSELALLHDPPVSKSCVNHRLAKICDIWEKSNKFK